MIKFRPFTLMDPLISEASYWDVLFISPRMTVSRLPDNAAFRAVIMSWKHNDTITLILMCPIGLHKGNGRALM